MFRLAPKQGSATESNHWSTFAVPDFNERIKFLSIFSTCLILPPSFNVVSEGVHLCAVTHKVHAHLERCFSSQHHRTVFARGGLLTCPRLSVRPRRFPAIFPLVRFPNLIGPLADRWQQKIGEQNCTQSRTAPSYPVKNSTEMTSLMK